MTTAGRPSKNERRDAAREKARQQRVRQQKREKRGRLLLQGAIGLVVVAIVVVVAVVIVNSVKPAGPGPRNMANGGITLSGADLAAVSTGAAAADATPTPQPTTSGKVLIQVWEDFGCPYCEQFETSNGPQVEALVKSGAADVQYFPVAILDRTSPNEYSSRSANAAAAVANWSPDSYSAFHDRLFAIQPTEGTAGPSDAQLIAAAKRVKVSNLAQISAAIRDDRFAKWVEARTADFQDKGGALADADLPTQFGTPTVLVNGQYYSGQPSDTDAFGSFVTSVGGAYTATPTPTPTPSASAG